MYAPLKAVAQGHQLYLDYKHPRPARGGMSKVAWRDRWGNTHDLDYVLEQGGTEAHTGDPKAFIEVAWRRYTKHSRNKAQEIQGAVVPLAETYSRFNPFRGAVLAGVFTEGSLQQLRSHGFTLLYIPYESIVRACAVADVDAYFDEATSDEALAARVASYRSLPEAKKARVSAALLLEHASSMKAFIRSLERSLGRTIARILIVSLHGPTHEARTIKHAVEWIRRHRESEAVSGFVRYEVQVDYSNGDKIEAEFQDKATAIEFLGRL
jgi:hypothetical protein